ncbi:hypothetical protein A9Q96_16880 [Rhodobacterales bacterium 52_120_T64]|nr:hypothetical protein A9Q96_16880 [Rhodobacterales bacterium 52_120_T64]
MDKSTAGLILSSLCERATGAGGPVVLTSAELAAIQELFGPEQGDTKGQTQTDIEASLVIAPETPPFTPKVVWHPSDKPDQSTMLCLDFGTSFSKAFVCEGDDSDEVPKLIDVTFGKDESGQPQFLLPSEIFIHGGEIHFGATARRKFNLVEASQDRLIDNPKQYMTLGTDVAELNQKPLRSEQDASQSFSQRDVLVLYLAHLNRMVSISLEDSGHSIDILRRYAHPAWEKSSEKANGEAMARIMAEAVALAHLFPGDFAEKTSVDRAQKLAIAARETATEALPFELLKDSVREATAAGAGALMETDPGKRQAFVILDIGAGTTDVAGCICINDPRSDQVRVAEVTPAAKALNRAGNIIDSALLKVIFEECSLARGTTEYERTRQILRKSVRSLKESLFNDGFVVVPLATGETIEIELDNFLESQPMKKLFGDIKEIVAEAAFLVSGSEGTVFLVPTGGGSRLPVIDFLIAEPLRKGRRNIQLKLRDAMPDDLKPSYPSLMPVYSQLAVAVGGALPSLPTQIRSISEGIVDPGEKALLPVYTSPHQ